MLVPFFVDPLKLVDQSSFIIEAELNKPLELNCTLRGTRLQEVKWFRDATLVQHIPKTSEPVTRLRIASVQIEDLGIYQCFAHSSSQNVGGRIQVVLKGKADHIKIRPPQIKPTENSPPPQKINK